MGWVSYIEDDLERTNDKIRRAEAAPEDREQSLKALEDAKAIRTEVQKDLELATSPDLDLVHEIKTRDKHIGFLQDDLEVAKSEAEKLKQESDGRYAQLQTANNKIMKLQEEKRKLKEDFERVARNDFGAAVDTFPSPGMLRKHKPNG